jgi:hypothetical protein
VFSITHYPITKLLMRRWYVSLRSQYRAGRINGRRHLPNPVHVRDMMLRKHLSADKSLELNRLFVEYQKFFGEAQKLGKEILRQLAG